MKNKYVIRYTRFFFRNRVREYFTNWKEAAKFVRDLGLPKSQIKRL